MGDLRSVRTALGMLGNAEMDAGNLAAARDAYRRAKEIVDQEPANSSALGFWYANMGAIALQDDHLEEAESLLLEARRWLSEAQPVWYLGAALSRLGAVYRRRADLDQAEEVFAAAFSELRRYGAVVGTIGCLEETARLALQRKQPERAATLLAAASALRDASGAALTSTARREFNHSLAQVRAALPSDRFDPAWARGRLLSLDEAIAVATVSEEVKEEAADDQPVVLAALTRRELEVADLVAEGLTNAAIAQRLAISPGTARIHVERVREKLGCTSRVQIAAWVIRQRDTTSAH
jgi:DNA-binding NarL/FixJ family response regulator